MTKITLKGWFGWYVNIDADDINWFHHAYSVAIIVVNFSSC